MIEPSGGRVTYLFDAVGGFQRVTNPQGQRTTVNYDAAGRVTNRTYSHRGENTYEYDDADQLTLVTQNDFQGEPITSFDYAYDAVGNRTRLKRWPVQVASTTE